MIKKALIGTAVVVTGVVVLFLGYVFTRPTTFHVERSATVQAPVELVFDLVNTMEERHRWYTWDRLDPAMTRTYGDVKAGVGATYHWKGNDQVGEGRQTILASEPGRKIVDQLEFIEPFASTSTATFTFEPAGSHTRVTWSLDGGGGFSTRLMNALMDMDAAVGADFEQGLRNLDEVAQAETKLADAP